MYSYSHGRFTSPDYFANDTHTADPQSWNLYNYVRNNPLKYIDITGKELVLSIFFSYTHIEKYRVVSSDKGTYKLVNINSEKDFDGKDAQVKFIEGLINQQNPNDLDTLIGMKDLQDINIGIYEIRNPTGAVIDLYGNEQFPNTVTGTDSSARVTSDEQSSVKLLKEIITQVRDFLGEPLEESKRKLFNIPIIESEPTETLEETGSRRLREERNRSTVLNGNGPPLIPPAPIMPHIPPPPPPPRH